MSNNPDQIRADIENTRSNLGQDVDALADKVTPSKIVDRQMGKVKSAVGSVRERVMGATSDARGGLSDVRDGLSDAPGRAVEKAKGNPLAVGLIAFGVGWLAASLIPASEKEKELAGNLKDAAQPLVEDLTDAAKQVGENLKEPAQQAFTSVKDAATDGVDSVKSEAGTAADDMSGEVREAKHAVDDERGA
jgi:ElaB/YqjD/DUF883 family membrane-anchored ribosome-binding protein